MIVEKDKREKLILEVDLTGPDGNVFNLIGMGRNMCGPLGIDKDQFVKEMMSGDYENAVQTFEKYFGDFVILFR